MSFLIPASFAKAKHRVGCRQVFWLPGSEVRISCSLGPQPTAAPSHLRNIRKQWLNLQRSLPVTAARPRPNLTAFPIVSLKKGLAPCNRRGLYHVSENGQRGK